ncbi:MAG: PKD domain-containing protein, partial [Fibrella sp.]|nr:PKD domain-containing protein [Armatimonadota bacterium]
DGPVSLGDLKNIGIELKKTVGTGADAPTTLGVDILGWDFAFELNEAGRQTMQDAGIDAKFVRIPREVLEKKAVDQGDIKFFELAALGVDVQAVGKTVTVILTDFVMPTDDVPQEVQTAITHWSQWIDYWATDWNNRGDAFHNEWQDYRTRKKRNLQHRVTHTYAEPGTYKIVVKVIDILGNDTTKTVSVTI